MKLLNKLYIILILFGLINLSACESYLDINTDPTSPASATNIQLLPAAQASASLAFSNMLERAAATLVQHYINFRFDNYGFDGATYNNDWSFHLYNGSLQDYKTIIEQGTASQQWEHVGVSKLHMAYIFSLLVDLFGDVPFSEALQASGNFNPKADNGADVYPQLFTMIDEGLADLEKDATVSLGGEDLIYGGDIGLWQKMGNTLKLKLYNQLRKVDENMAKSGIENLLQDESQLINANADDFQFQFNTSNAPEGRHPNFQANYAAGGLENNMSSYFVNLLNTTNDPRVPYYFYKQAGCTLAGTNGGESSSAGDDEDRAIEGIYPVGGKYDDNSCLVHNENMGLRGAGIFPMITNTMVKFIQAEAALTMNTPGDPRELLEEGINSSFLKIEGFSNLPMADTVKENYIEGVLANYDEAETNEERLGVIMMEKYKALYGNGIESYNDLRRTGYPNNLNTPVVQNGPFPRRFPIPPVEVTSNASIDPQTDLTVKVFWDVES